MKMVLTFYPHADDAEKGSIDEKIDILMEAAERYKAIILDHDLSAKTESLEALEKKRMIPRDLKTAYNWQEIARVLREAREIPEISRIDKMKKADLLTKLSEVYEVLRAAKMPKLEAVRLALISEANQLRSSAPNVA